MITLSKPLSGWRWDESFRPFDDLPVELKILIISYVDLDPRTFRNLSLVNHQTRDFLKRHETELVKHVVQRQDRLEALLVLSPKPPFNDYLTLQIQERSLRSSVRTVKENGVYKIVFQDGLWLMAIFIHLGAFC
jgi:hypothetical protein